RWRRTGNANDRFIGRQGDVWSREDDAVEPGPAQLQQGVDRTGEVVTVEANERHQARPNGANAVASAGTRAARSSSDSPDTAASQASRIARTPAPEPS